MSRMTFRFLAPPDFKEVCIPALDDEDNYAKWRYDIEMWSLCTNLANNKSGPAIFLALPPSIRDCVRSIPKADVAKEGGLDLILQALDKIYLADANTRAYLCFKEFYSFKRASGVSVPQFLVQFENHCKRMFYLFVF